MSKQITISKTITFNGHSMHSGKMTQVLLEAAPENHGITINDVLVTPYNVTNTDGMTTVGNVSQTEHLLSALFALRIDNLKITINSNEMPIMGGANKSFIDTFLIKKCMKILISNKQYFFPQKKFLIKENDSLLSYEPWDDPTRTDLHFDCYVDFPYVGKQQFSWNSNDFKLYYDQISSAKTFFWREQFQKECEKGRCKGVIENKNCIVFSDNNNLNNNELAKHKLLDFIGDLKIFNIIIPGKYTTIKGGHRLNNKFVMKLWNHYQSLKQIKNNEININNEITRKNIET